MKFFRIINKIVSYCYFLGRFGSPQLAYRFSHYRLSFQTALQVTHSEGMLRGVDTGNQIPVKLIPLYQLELEKLVMILNDRRVSVMKYDRHGFTLKIYGITLQVLSISNIVTVFEIFFERLYDVYLPQGDCICIDIGMNVAYASLFFASKQNITRIYAFEPFAGTYREALENLRLNPQLAEKIVPANAGISNYTGTTAVPVMESGSGGASTSRIIIDQQATAGSLVTVSIRNVTEVLRGVMSKHPQSAVYLKVDCEGEEYAIMEALHAAGLLPAISGMLIEWHLLGFQPIIDTLQAGGFTILNLPARLTNSGMIYAFRLQDTANAAPGMQHVKPGR